MLFLLIGKVLDVTSGRHAHTNSLLRPGVYMRYIRRGKFPHLIASSKGTVGLTQNHVHYRGVRAL